MRAVSRNTVRCKSSPLGLIPKEWAVESVDKCFNLLRNNTFSRAMLDEQPGQICNVHYGDVLIKYDTIIDCNHDRLPSLRQDVRIGKDADYAQDGDLIFADTAEDDTVGKAVELVNVGNLKIVSGLHTIFMRPKERRFASKWLGYFVNSDAFHSQLMPFVVGSKVSSISRGNIKRAHVLIPTEDAQRRIVEILSTCDEVITRSRAAVEKLRKIKAGMLNDFFTRGIADDGRLRPPPQQAPKLYKDSPLGPIPKEWEVETVDECFDLLRNNTLSRAMLIEQPGRIYNVHYGDVLVKYETIVDCARDRLPSLRADVSLGSSVDYAQEGDLVFADTAEDDTVGKAVELVNVGDLKVVSGLHTIFMRSKTRRFASRWLGYFVNSAAFHSQLLPFVAGSKVSSISRGNIKRVSVLIPSGEEQCRVVERMASIDEEIRREEDLIAKYRSVKAGLMQRLLSPPTDAEVVDETIREAV